MRPAEARAESLWSPDFWIAGTSAPRRDDGLFELQRSDGTAPGLLQLPNAPADLYNARLPSELLHLERDLRPLCSIPRMSTFTVAALINRLVAAMRDDEAFVNVGVWNGFTFLSGLVANPDRHCVGIDNFSQFKGPKDAFLERFERLRSPRHDFHEMDYREYFARVHAGPIGVYLYDGDHSYDDQLRGLEVAEPFLHQGSIVLVDDTNWNEPREATFEFMRRASLEYELLLDERTGANAHPTLWNGLMVIRAMGPKRQASHPPGRDAGEQTQAAPELSEPPRTPSGAARRVSIVVHDREGVPDRLGGAIDRALAQQWDELEVLVVLVLDESGSDSCTRLVDDYGDRVRRVDAAGSAGAGLPAALQESEGDVVAFVDAGVPLRETAVKIALAYPRLVQFFRPLDDATWSEREKGLTAAEEVLAAIPAHERLVVAAEAMQPPRTLGLDRVVRLEAARSPDISDDQALAELERLRGDGAGAIVFLWPAFEWLERHPRLYDHLQAVHTLLLDNERLKLFDIREK